MKTWQKKYITLLLTAALGFGGMALSSCDNETGEGQSSPIQQSSVASSDNSDSLQDGEIGGESASVEDETSSLEESSSAEQNSSVTESTSSEDEASSDEPENTESSAESEDTESSPAPDEPEKPEESKYAYNDFTEHEKSLFMQYVGEIIPFAPNDEYYVEGYYDTYDYENGLCFYTFGNTKAEFEEYRALYADYDLIETYEDDYGDTWYWYEKGDVVVDMSYYYYEGENWLIVYVYSSLSDGETDGSDESSSEDWWEDGSSDDSYGDETDVNLLTNKGKGLPNDSDGVYDVDFTKAEYAKNVTEQGYYLDGCPTVGEVSVLVIPVEFSDVTAASKGYSIDKIEKAFNGTVGDTDYYSVSEYYSLSSYGKLDLNFVVADSWFKPAQKSSYYETQTVVEDGYEYAVGDQMVLDEALAQLSKTMDLSAFDSDGNAVIDAVVMITTLDIDDSSDFYWAYRYWNYYTDDEGYYYEYDGVSANDYLWASYQFLYESYDGAGNVTYDASVMNTYTYIHEFGHVLGADDYYDTAYVGDPMEGCDIMDGMLGDHNAYTKFNYGWLTSSRLVVAEESVTLTLESFSQNGDTVIVANNWDDALGVYQEYFVVAYYTGDGLNGGDGGYFDEDGIVVYHVNASLYVEEYEGETYYDVYNTNTDISDENGYGTKNNLIELVKASDYAYTYGVGDSLSSSLKDDNGDEISYVFTVESMDGKSATLTFSKNG